MQLFDNKLCYDAQLQLSPYKELVKLSEIDTRIIEINEKDVLENDNLLDNDSEFDSKEEIVFKGRNSKYPKRVIFS